jgi:tRNA pseudouridine38-40 synthase
MASEDAPPPLRTLKLVVEYDGTNFAGWQRQDGQRTVQGCLEDGFRAMTGQAVVVRGAGRTDAGVHA